MDSQQDNALPTICRPIPVKLDSDSLKTPLDSSKIRTSAAKEAIMQKDKLKQAITKNTYSTPAPPCNTPRKVFPCMTGGLCGRLQKYVNYTSICAAGSSRCVPRNATLIAVQPQKFTKFHCALCVLSPDSRKSVSADAPAEYQNVIFNETPHPEIGQTVRMDYWHELNFSNGNKLVLCSRFVALDKSDTNLAIQTTSTTQSTSTAARADVPQKLCQCITRPLYLIKDLNPMFSSACIVGRIQRVMTRGTLSPAIDLDPLAISPCVVIQDSTGILVVILSDLVACSSYDQPKCSREGLRLGHTSTDWKALLLRGEGRMCYLSNLQTQSATHIETLFGTDMHSYSFCASLGRVANTKFVMAKPRASSRFLLDVGVDTMFSFSFKRPYQPEHLCGDSSADRITITGLLSYGYTFDSYHNSHVLWMSDSTCPDFVTIRLEVEQGATFKIMCSKKGLLMIMRDLHVERVTTNEQKLSFDTYSVLEIIHPKAPDDILERVHGDWETMVRSGILSQEASKSVAREILQQHISRGISTYDEMVTYHPGACTFNHLPLRDSLVTVHSIILDVESVSSDLICECQGIVTYLSHRNTYFCTNCMSLAPRSGCVNLKAKLITPDTVPAPQQQQPQQQEPDTALNVEFLLVIGHQVLDSVLSQHTNWSPTASTDDLRTSASLLVQQRLSLLCYVHKHTPPFELYAIDTLH
ncbi:hypothetical protein Pelo_10440 [Pelomyxa schiedti]|nr:hypothetical protein Pelo_10440 [Pelomyxa schiedti]